MQNSKINLAIKINIIFFTFFFFAKNFCVIFNLLTEYVYLIDFIWRRLCWSLLILTLLKIFLNLEFVNDVRKEMEIFDEGPENKSVFISYIRKCNLLLLFTAYVEYTLAITYFLGNEFLSFLLGLLALISLILYAIQFVIYTDEYFKKSFKSNKNIINNSDKSQIKSMFTAANLGKLLIVCFEFLPGIISIIFIYDIGYKLMFGGMDIIPPFRQYTISKEFPEYSEKIWTESSLAEAVHNRAMGISKPTK